MKNNLKWRLGKLPTSEEVRDLVKDKIITNEEAREVLFSSETEEDRDKKSLESEIKFLRELVEKLSSSKTTIVETIRTIEKPYLHYQWVQPYQYWCTAGGGAINTIGTTYCSADNTLLNGVTAQANSIQCSTAANYQDSSFTDIQTF